MRKKIIIEGCTQCPHCVIDDNDVLERWGKVWCMLLDQELKYKNESTVKLKMPRNCPLENA